MTTDDGQGLPCPECGIIIPVTMQQLLFSPRITCPACALSLTVDQTESAEALDSLRAYYNRMEEIKQANPEMG